MARESIVLRRNGDRELFRRRKEELEKAVGRELDKTEVVMRALEQFDPGAYE